MANISKPLTFPSESLQYTGLLTLPQHPFSQHHSVFFYETYVKVWNGLENKHFSYPEWESHFSRLARTADASLSITQNFVSPGVDEKLFKSLKTED